MVTNTQITTGYKQTDIGVIPEDWDIDVIKSHASITTGAKNTQDKINEGSYPFFVRSQNIERINSYSFDGEAVLTAGDGVGTGKVFHYINGKFDFHQRVYKMSDFSEKLDGYFFYLYFSTHFYDRIMSMTAKSSVDSVRMEMIANMHIPLPPKPEQKAIALALLDIATLVTKLDELIEKKRSIKQGTMQELLTGKRRLPGFSGEWEEKKLGELAEFYKGKGLPKSAIVEDGKFKCIHYGELFLKYAEEINEILSHTDQSEGNFLSKANDVLMPTSDVTPNGLATASCIREDNVILGGDILVIRSSVLLDGTFLSYSIANDRDQIMSLVSGTTVYHLYASDMSKFEFKLPDLKEQQSIVQILNDMDIELEDLETQRNKYLDFKQGMMQQLLTGKIRLV